VVRKIRVMFFKNYSEQADGSFAGIQFFDKVGDVILQAGFINKPTAALYASKDYELEEGERVIGMKSQLKEKGSARHWDL
jgi:hypothetical protein